MIKRLIAIGGATALLLGAAVPALAWGGWGSRDVAIVGNEAVAVANTGGNTQDNFAAGDEAEVEDNDGDRYMDTGDADAYAGALVVANTHVGCDCDEDNNTESLNGGGGSNHKDFALVGNGAGALANTGDNAQDDVALGDGDDAEVEDNDGNRTMYTGNASSTARAWTIVNTHLWD